MIGTILIVDKEAPTRRSLTDRLVRQGWLVLEAGGLEEASAAVRRGGVDVALLDLPSLENEALLVLQVLRDVSPATESVLMTGPEQIALAIRGMKMGAFDDVQMPLDLDQLLAKIALALESSREKGRASPDRQPRSDDARRT